MWAVWAASCQAAGTPVELIESAGRFPFRSRVTFPLGRIKTVG